jgi:glutamyl-tRNA synthetase
LRWHAPRGRIAIDDAITGPIEEDVETDIGDFVLRRGDGAWAYQLAVVVDDAAMAISEVVRGEDLLASTPRQVLLARALGLAVPRFAHVPLLLGPDGQKLSKRHGAPSMAELREGGADPARVVAVLARSAGLVGAHVERVTPRELVDDFDLARVVGATNVLDPAALA